jgi:hypothetical protein
MKGKRWMFVVLALAGLLGACDRDVEDGKLRGKDVLVLVRLVGIAEEKEEDITRSISMKETQREAIPIGDGMVMEMRMERDTSALRAVTKVTLDGNSYFRVVAVIHGTSTFISYCDYTINGHVKAGGLHVPDNDSYDFICYSYNSNAALPALNYAQDDNIPTTAVIDASVGGRACCGKR